MPVFDRKWAFLRGNCTFFYTQTAQCIFILKNIYLQCIFILTDIYLQCIFILKEGGGGVPGEGVPVAPGDLICRFD